MLTLIYQSSLCQCIYMTLLQISFNARARRRIATGFRSSNLRWWSAGIRPATESCSFPGAFLSSVFRVNDLVKRILPSRFHDTPNSYESVYSAARDKWIALIRNDSVQAGIKYEAWKRFMRLIKF